MEAPRTTDVKLSFCYGDYTVVYEFDGGTEYKERHTLVGDRTPDDDEFQIDLAETDPAVIARYREFADKNPKLYDDCSIQEMFVQASGHANDDPNAWRSAAKLHRMCNAIKESSDAFEPHFERLVNIFANARHNTKYLTKITFEYAGHISQYDLAGDEQYENRQIPTGDRTHDRGEFLINVHETDPDEIAAYRRLADEDRERYDDLYAEEMFVLLRSHADGNQDAKAEAEALFRMNLAITEKDTTADFEPYFAKFLGMFEKVKDWDREDHPRISIEYGGVRSQYVFDEKTNMILRKPIEGGSYEMDEFVFDVDAADPAVIARYERFVGENQERYLRMLDGEMRHHADDHRNGYSHVKDYAQRLFNMNQRFKETAVPEDFEAYFARYVESAGAGLEEIGWKPV